MAKSVGRGKGAGILRRLIMAGLKDKLYNEENVLFTEGKITLLNRRELECYPCVSELKDENGNVKGLYGRKAVDYNYMEFDTTGKYLSFGKKRGRSKDYIEDFELFIERQLFVDNAFLLLQTGNVFYRTAACSLLL